MAMNSSPSACISRSARWRTLISAWEGRTLGSVAAGDRRKLVDPRVGRVLDRDDVGADLAQDRRREAVVLFEDGEQEVGGGGLGVAALRGEPQRGCDGVARHGGEAVVLHAAHSTRPIAGESRNLSRNDA